MESGIAFADSRINENSASYIEGQKNGSINKNTLIELGYGTSFNVNNWIKSEYISEYETADFIVANGNCNSGSMAIEVSGKAQVSFYQSQPTGIYDPSTGIFTCEQTVLGVYVYLYSGSKPHTSQSFSSRVIMCVDPKHLL